MALTDSQLRNTKPTEKDYTIIDYQGLSMLITSKGLLLPLHSLCFLKPAFIAGF